MFVSASIDLASLTQANEDITPIVFRDGNGNVESFVNATPLGIEIYGPMPTDDAILVDDLWTAEPGTNSHAWTRTKVEIDWDSLEEMEQIDLAAYTGDNRTGTIVRVSAEYNIAYPYANSDSIGVTHHALR